MGSASVTQAPTQPSPSVIGEPPLRGPRRVEGPRRVDEPHGPGARPRRSRRASSPARGARISRGCSCQRSGKARYKAIAGGIACNPLAHDPEYRARSIDLYFMSSIRCSLCHVSSNPYRHVRPLEHMLSPALVPAPSSSRAVPGSRERKAQRSLARARIYNSSSRPARAQASEGASA